jgi:molybdate transport system ATP-binding protein
MSWRVAIQGQIGALTLDVAIQGTTAPVALVGPNGCGKTTLLRMIAGAHCPTSGVIQVGGRTLFDSAAGQSLPIEQRRVGYVPQGYGLFPHLRAVDNVAFGLTGSRASRQQRARVALDSVQAGPLSARWPRELSGGEQQRVALARALTIDPAILLLDEPLSALDVAARRSVRAFLVAHLAAQNRPSLVVTHDVRDVVALDARVCVMDAGRVVQDGSVAELRADPVNDFVAEFVAA